MVYYKCYLIYTSPVTGEKGDGYAYVSFDKNDPHAIWTYFSFANYGSRTWAITEITEHEFKKGPILHADKCVVVQVDENFKEKFVSGRQ